MSYRIVSSDGLRARGTKIRNEGDIISDGFYEANAVENGWEGKVEKVSGDTSKSAKSTTPARVTESETRIVKATPTG